MLRRVMTHLRVVTLIGVHLMQTIQDKIVFLKQEFKRNELYMGLIGPNSSEYTKLAERQQVIEDNLEELNDILWDEQSQDYHTNF